VELNRVTENKYFKELSLLDEDTLDLSNRGITSIGFLKKLSNEDKNKLKILDISHNKIKDNSALKNVIDGLEILKIEKNDFALEDNILKDRVRDEENHLSIMKEFFEGLSDKPRHAKILLLGNHATGKSTFLDKMYDIACTGSTHVLAVYKNDKDGVNYFDFGGQDYYHGINQLFFNENALNLLFWYSKKNKNEEAPDSRDGKRKVRNYNREYWLNQIKHTLQRKNIELIRQRGDNVKDIKTESWNNDIKNKNRIVLFQTHADDPAEEKKIGQFADKFDKDDFAIDEFFVGLTSQDDVVEDGNNFAVEKGNKYYERICDFIKKIKPIKDVRFYHKDELEILKKIKAPNSQIDLDELKEIDLADKEKLRSYLKNLHDDGELIYYDNGDFFRSDIKGFIGDVHEKYFGTGLINKGKFYKGENTCDTNGKCYKGEVGCDKKCLKEIDDVVKFLLHEKIIFKNINNKKECEYIVPSYLPLVKDDKENIDFQLYRDEFDREPNFILKFLWFIPFGLINNLICYFGNLPDIKRYWRDAVVFTLLKEYRIRISLDFQKLAISVYIADLLESKEDPRKKKHLMTMEKVEQFVFYQILNLYWSLNDNETDFNFVDLNILDKKDEKLSQYRIRINKDIETFLSTIKDIKTSRQTERKGLGKFTGDQEKNLEILLNLFPDDMYLSVDDECFVKYTDIDSAKSEEKIVAYKWEQNDGDKRRLNFSLPVPKSLNQFRRYTMNKVLQKAKIFISYSHEDTAYREQLETHLACLKDDGIDVYYDKIGLGENMNADIVNNLKDSNIVMYLISPDFINSKYIKDVEANVKYIDGKRLIPVRIRACDWKTYNKKVFDGLQEANHGKILTVKLDKTYEYEGTQRTGPEMDAFWANIVKDLRESPEIIQALENR
jgi:internalin A